MQTLQRLIESYLGLPPSGAGEGTHWELSWTRSSITSWPWAVLLAAAAVYVAWVYRVETKRLRPVWRWVLPALRLAVLAIVALWLGGLTLNVVRTGLPVVVVLIDTSASMGLSDRYARPADAAAVRRMADPAQTESPTRLSLAQRLLLRDDASLLRRLGQDYRVRLYQFSETAQPLVPGSGDDVTAELAAEVERLTASGARTRPGPSLRQVLEEHRGAPPAAVIVLTDGVASVVDDDRLSRAASVAGARSTPLFPVGLGSSEPARDVQIYDLIAEPVALVDDPITFEFRLRGYDYPGKAVEVTLRESGESEVLARTSVVLPPDDSAVPVRMTVGAGDEGEREYVVEAQPFPDETTTDNNRLVRRVRVRRAQIRVLLADRAPRWEYRHLKGVLERDDAVELHTVLQEADLAHQQEDRTALAAFPSAGQELFSYDVIILGDIDLTYLNPGVLRQLREFVAERSGGLVLIAGERHNPHDFRGTELEPLLPMEPGARPTGESATPHGAYQVLPTPAGSASPLFQLTDDAGANEKLWSELPPLYWAWHVVQKKPAAQVLAVQGGRHTAEGRLPVILLQRYGSGQVLFHATDELWQWRRRTEDLYYGRYWLQAVRFLCRSRLLGGVRAVEMTSDRSTYEQGESVRLRVRIVDPRWLPDAPSGVRVAVERDGGPREMLELAGSELAPLVFEGELAGALPGAYHAWLAAPALAESPPACDFRVEAPRRELQQRSADLADLARAAEASGGAAFTLADLDQLVARLPGGRAVPVANAESAPLWSRGEFLVLFVVLLGAEWLFRKRARLV